MPKLSYRRQQLLNEHFQFVPMFNSLVTSYQKLADKSGIDESRLRFRGYDSHKDSEGWMNHHVGGFCSHTEMLPTYRRMFSRWQGCKDPQNLTREEILRIIDYRH